MQIVHSLSSVSSTGGADGISSSGEGITLSGEGFTFSEVPGFSGVET